MLAHPTHSQSVTHTRQSGTNQAPIMNYKQAIKLLAPYHAAQLIWVIPTDNDAAHTAAPAPTGQLTTGLDDYPIIPVNNGEVCADDLYDALAHYTLTQQHTQQPAPIPYGLFELAPHQQAY